MKTELKNVLHLYMGCQIRNIGNQRVFLAKGDEFILVGENIESALINKDYFKPVLRPLSDMTEDEALVYFQLPENAIIINKKDYSEAIIFEYKWKHPVIEYNTSDGNCYGEIGIGKRSQHFNSTEFLFLLKNHFDIFGLIESGQAIDKTTLNK